MRRRQGCGKTRQNEYVDIYRQVLRVIDRGVTTAQMAQAASTDR
jgi:hypothetical protein